MGFSKRLSKKKLPEIDPEQLLQTLKAFIQAENWRATQHIVKQHPELLTDKADALLGQLLEAQKTEGARQIIEEHRALLRRCREVGIENAFVEKVDSASSTDTGSRNHLEIPPEFAAEVRELQNILTRLQREPHLASRHVAILEHIRARPEITRHPAFGAAVLNDLGNAYNDSSTGERGANLAHAIACYEEALRFRTPETAPRDYAMTQNNLGNAYAQLPTGDQGMHLARAIACYEEALRFRTPEAAPFQYASTQSNLGNAYRKLPTGDRGTHLVRAIAFYEEALRFWTPEATPFQYAGTQSNLGNAYSDLPTGDRGTHLARAIVCYEEALRIYTAETTPRDYAMTQNNLGNAYRDLPTGDRGAHLTRAIICYEEALRVYTLEVAPFDYAMAQNNLGNAYFQFPTGDRETHLARAIACYEEALRVYTLEATPRDYALTQNNLGNAYSQLPTGDRGTHLARAIACYEEALRVYTPETTPRDYALTQNNLGEAYRNLLTGDREMHLVRAIACYEEALRFRTPEATPFQYAGTQNNLGEAYRNLPMGDQGTHLARAIVCYEEALRFWTSETAPFEYAGTQNNLGNAYRDLPTGDLGTHLARAIACYEEALSVYTLEAAPRDYAMTQNNLGNAYFQLSIGDRRTHLARAIACYEEALRVYTPETTPLDYAMTQNNLGEAYRNLPTGAPGNEASHAHLARAVICYEEALRFRTPEASPDGHRHTQRNMGRLYFEQWDWKQVIAAYQGALAASELLYQAAALPVARQAELREVRDLPGELAYALARQGFVQQLQAAVLALEQNRARWLHESLSLQEVKPPTVPDTTWEIFVARQVMVQQLQTEARLPEDTPGKRDYLELSNLLAQARQQLQAAIAQVQVVASDFMPTPTFADVQATATEIPFVYIVTTSAGGLAFIVHNEDISSIWLDTLTTETLHESVRDYREIYSSWRNSPRGENARHAWFVALDKISKWIKTAIIQPIVDALYAMGATRAVLIPTDLLGLLPLHAAVPEGITFTYAPNARALMIIRRQSIDATHLLAIENPDNSLDFSKTEVASALDTFPEIQRSHLLGGKATLDNVRDALISHDVWHFSTHGWAGWDTPLDGGLLLANGEHLTLRDLLQLKAHVRLAVLSACETGIPGTELPDEVISLPTGLLQAGVAGVVASLWAVNDFSTALLMMRFYEVWRKEGQEPPAALHTAQIWLRTSTNADIATYIKQHPPYRDEVYRQFYLAFDQEKCPFEHPYYWAGFYYTGV